MTYHMIYKTVNLVNSKYYYGVHSTENIDDGYLGSGYALQNAIKKYGSENFKREVIAFFDDREQALIVEAEIVNEKIISDPMCYNVVIGGGAPPLRTGVVAPTNLLKGDNRTEKQKLASAAHSEKMKSKTPWNKGLTGKQTAWNKGISGVNGDNGAGVKRTCPHCNKTGFGNGMLRWHFDNCKHKGAN